MGIKERAVESALKRESIEKAASMKEALSRANIILGWDTVTEDQVRLVPSKNFDGVYDGYFSEDDLSFMVMKNEHFGRWDLYVNVEKKTVFGKRNTWEKINNPATLIRLGLVPPA